MDGIETAASDTELDIRHPKLRTLYRFWQSRYSPGHLPSRQDFLPEDLGEWMGNLGIYEVEREPLRFRYRLVGLNIVDYDGADFTGRYLDEFLLPHLRPIVLPQFERCVRERAPVAVHSETHDRLERPCVLDKLLLPTSSDETTVDRIYLALYAEFGRFGDGQRLVLQDLAER